LVDENIMDEGKDTPTEKVKKKRGRQPGSKNKIKTPSTISKTNSTSKAKPRLAKSSSKKEGSGPSTKVIRQKRPKASIYAESASEGTDDDDLLPAYGSKDTIVPSSTTSASSNGTTKKRSKSSPTSSEHQVSNMAVSDDEDFFELECGKCGEWFISKEVGLTRSKAENISEWFCPKCDDNNEDSSLPPSTNSKMKSKKRKSSSKDDDDEIENVNPTVIPYITCEPWPEWKEDITGKRLNDICVAIIDELFKDEDIEDVFGFPVPEDTPGYSVLIPSPMDLGTMRFKAEQGKYLQLSEVRADLELVVNNCMTFNIDGSEFFKMAQDLALTIHSTYTKIVNA